ncbi:hypothetical protein F2Q69_00052666 [Brassica cretica]|uniref:Uncharacterized protein n=1 Tax=Brassica cretica TaxID=69181 RepID=A0A8S9MYT6_BRACR|nr:hypothetical protein F2Q69_00052666 [Brassica cretica]
MGKSGSNPWSITLCRALKPGRLHRHTALKKKPSPWICEMIHEKDMVADPVLKDLHCEARRTSDLHADHHNNKTPLDLHH